ncbi:MAG: hypothetical protein OXG10_05795 [Candidatus Dadabacteria bacterium]|nr:hypothetical protein [Candidatus Dadabacteria bacterium]
MTKIHKSGGSTPTEKLLSQLCEDTFLKLWSYPNPYKNDRKELCDLIVVFEEHVFIFFDRESRKFDNASKGISVTWKRWKTEVIDKQIKTLKGAERYIRTGKPIFIDSKRETRLPIVVPENARIHKFVVAHGVEETLRKVSGKDYSGSLAISYGEHTQSSAERPFCVELEKEDPVHILDSSNVETVLRELDTISDFTEFINDKEKTIGTCESLLYFGEHELLAHYFLSYDESQNKYRINPGNPNSSIIAADGLWEYFAKSESYKRRKEANEISYFWDKLIQQVCQDMLDGALLNDIDLERGQHLVSEMAREPRFVRRLLSEEIRKEVRGFPETDHTVLPKVKFICSQQKDKGYVFLQLKCPQTGDFENRYRPLRQKMLEVACGVIRNRFANLNTVIGIGQYASKFSNGNSRDFILLDCSEWTEERQTFYETENENFGFFKNENMQKTIRYAEDFPEQENRT